MIATLGLWLAAPVLGADETSPAQVEVKDVTVDGKLDAEKARLVIEANLQGLTGKTVKPIYGVAIEHLAQVARGKITHAIGVRANAIQGALSEVVLTLAGDGEIRTVTGEGIEDWSLRQVAGGPRCLVIRLKKGDKPVTSFATQIAAETLLKEVPSSAVPLTVTAEQAALANGYVRLDAEPDLALQLNNPSGVVPVETKYLPEPMRASATAETLAFRFHGTAYSVPLNISIADPEARSVALSNFQLTGRLADDQGMFTLTATARVKNPRGGRLPLLAGGVALTDVVAQNKWKLRFENGWFVAVFDQAGEFPLNVKFNAAVVRTNGWSAVDFNVAPSALQPLTLAGLKAETQFRIFGGARPERSGENFITFLPPDGRLHMTWNEVRAESEGKLFYSVESLAQVAVSPGLLRQTVLLDFKVMQGEMNRVTLLMTGDGEVTRVMGPQVLSWQVAAGSSATEKRLLVQLNEAQKDQFAFSVQLQQPLGAFPVTVGAISVQPENAIRSGGYFRVVNEGAVRLEVTEASGLSQVSPEQYPQTDVTKALMPAQSTQVFAYRFSGTGFQLRLQADNILPDVSVSEVLMYHLTETELAIEADLELDVREAPLRELLLTVPKGYVVARLNASGMNDHFLTDVRDTETAQLRVVYGTPVAGRQRVELRLERNRPPNDTAWTLPRIELIKAKSVRGHLGVSADAGFRLTPAKTQGLTDIATAFFPKRVGNIQTAFRISDADWQAGMTIERLPQSVQADAFHLFSVGEGIAYGSTIVNYLVSGAPIAALKVELSDEYFNVEFNGRDVRGWQKTEGGYLVQLHRAVSGMYTLLATYERPFKPQGEQLAFTGARPLDAQTEQGHTVVVSTYQFQVEPANVSSALTTLEPGEVPAEFRLFFDAPILAAYRYNARPFNLQLTLKPLAQGEMVSQVVDRAALTTRISEEGQIVTDARYLVKNKGTPHLRLVLPEGDELWSVTVNGERVVPVKDDRANLIPLPQRTDPNTVNDVQVKTASRAKSANRLRITAPAVTAPVLLADWHLQADSGRRLIYRNGTLTPVSGLPDTSGFAQLQRLSDGPSSVRAGGALFLVVIALVLGALCLRFASAKGVTRLGWRHAAFGLLGIAGCGLAILVLLTLIGTTNNHRIIPEGDLRFVAPIQQAGSALNVELSNARAGVSWFSQVWALAPLAVAAVVAGYTLLTGHDWLRRLLGPLMWVLVFWATLRLSNGAAAFCAVGIAFVLFQVLIPGLRRWWQVPPPPTPDPAPPVAATAALLLAGALLTVPETRAQVVATKNPPLAESVIQQMRIEDDFVFAKAAVRWQAIKGQVLPLLHTPGVLTRLNVPAGTARLIQIGEGEARHQAIVADRDGDLSLDVEYQARVQVRDGQRGFVVPTQYGLVNRLAVTVIGADVDLHAANSVSIQREAAATTNTVANLVLAPVNQSWVTMKPRSRDTRREKAVLYAELSQLFVPGPGVIEGLHHLQLRPAQGEVAELLVEVPAGTTVTDVQAPQVSLWRFDPDSRVLRIGLTPAQSRPFAVVVRSQVVTGPLPFEKSIGLISVKGITGQLGLVGIATGGEVQLDDVQAGAFSAINLEDFPAGVIESLRSQVADLTLRRAFRYSDSSGVAVVKASPVEPDVRLSTQQTLSLGEDRVVLAANLTVDITRAGIFKLSFPLPDGLDVESVSGTALSHWTELKTDEGRLITLNLKGKTVGSQQFSIGLAGPGLRSKNGWRVPQLVLREAAKQQGQLLLVPEQGMRLQVASREGATPFDPLTGGVRQKGVLGFRLLQRDWALTLNVERVDAWVQVTGLQHVTITDAQFKVAANLEYSIENNGVRALRVRLPAVADSVRFKGEQVADFLPIEGGTNGAMKDWEVKLHRRIIGRYLLQVSYNQPVGDQASEASVAGVMALDVNTQRGFLTLQSSGRLQVTVGALPDTLQPTEWQVIPRSLQQDITTAAANQAFRLVEPGFVLPLKLQRHQAARLLPARVTGVQLTSVIADDGMVLTHARLQLTPGDKRLLNLTLPESARFWFAFVNQNSVWPWRETNRILVPLEQHARSTNATTVDFFYTCPSGTARTRSLDLRLVGPKFDLPLENIAWRVFLNEKWRVTDWSGSVQYQGEQLAGAGATVDLQGYVQQQASIQLDNRREAEQLLNLGNSLLVAGDQLQARRNFKAAYGLSQGDQAFNEDARVQLQNLKTQQALVGLNVVQNRFFNEPAGQQQAARAVAGEAFYNYTQAEAKQMIERNTAEDNAFQVKLAERLIQQQDAAVANPAAIRASVPEQGRLLTFARPLQVDTWADLSIQLEAHATRDASPAGKLFLLLGVLLCATATRWALGRAKPAHSVA